MPNSSLARRKLRVSLTRSNTSSCLRVKGKAVIGIPATHNFKIMGCHHFAVGCQRSARRSRARTFLIDQLKGKPMADDSLFDLGAMPDRRRHARTAAVSRPVLIETGNFCGYCVLSNLSPKGMAAATDTRFVKGEAVCVQFMPNHAVPGRIIWSHEDRLGIEFDRRFDIATAFGTGAGAYSSSHFSRPPRLNLDSEAMATMGKAELKIVARDISQFDVRVMLPSAVPGERVEIRFPEGSPHGAEVRWAQRFDAGLRFERALSFEELARLAVACRLTNSRERAESLRRSEDYWEA
jgi:hypothetical protein